MIEKKGDEIYWNQRKIGEIVLDRFTTHRKPEHFYRKVGGFCFNKELLPFLSLFGVNKIVVIYHGKKYREIFVTSVEKLRLYGTEIKEPPFEEQIGLSTKDFDAHLRETKVFD